MVNIVHLVTGWLLRIFSFLVFAKGAEGRWKLWNSARDIIYDIKWLSSWLLRDLMNLLTRWLNLSGKISFMGWLWLVGSLKLQVSFAEFRLFCRALLQKRPIILRHLLIVATPYQQLGKCNEPAHRWWAGKMLFVGMISKSAPPSEMTVELTFERFYQQLSTATGCCHNSWEWRRAALAHSWCVWVGVWVGVGVYVRAYVYFFVCTCVCVFSFWVFSSCIRERERGSKKAPVSCLFISSSSQASRQTT